ncbi:GIY-YIG nuclease family protein [Caulobacter sp. RHG1]|uniref:GIY-YIG nuclease family protein n=1 Tax=Caulobacter sp. (strain RHG1) TaxID=2545762 RepID=UPI0015582E6B|nr:GIY-YIG nuclease family protein [Caulobacter sp. RHG1]NQE62884.1 Excinuclease ABC, C subunit-like [Caulobacter sp. RHG1]
MVGKDASIAVYIMTDRYRGTLYIGVTSQFQTRMIQHRDGLIPGFTKRYGLKRLVWFETHDEMTVAIQRERSLKEWPRQWKINLIERDNPQWEDLYAAVCEWTPVPRQI